MDDIAKAVSAQLRAIEARHRKMGKRLERMQEDHKAQGEALEGLHQALADAVAAHGCDAGMSPEVVANITGPKVPPSDD